MSTPAGKGGGLNVTIDIEVFLKPVSLQTCWQIVSHQGESTKCVFSLSCRNHHNHMLSLQRVATNRFCPKIMGWTKTVTILLMTNLPQGSRFHPGQKVGMIHCDRFGWWWCSIHLNWLTVFFFYPLCFIPAGHKLQQIIMKQYFNPPDLNSFFGSIEPPRLENIFNKSKPRYFKRTSSAVWHSPPMGSK